MLMSVAAFIDFIYSPFADDIVSKEISSDSFKWKQDMNMHLRVYFSWSM